MRPMVNLPPMPAVSGTMPTQAFRKLRNGAAQVRAARPSQLRKSKSTPTLPTPPPSTNPLHYTPNPTYSLHPDSEPDELTATPSSRSRFSNYHSAEHPSTMPSTHVFPRHFAKTNPSASSNPCPQNSSQTTANIIPGSYTASCMRRVASQGLNVGELHIANTHLFFHARFVTAAPADSRIALPLNDILSARRARGRARAALPHAMMVRTRGYVDYIFALSSRDELREVIDRLTVEKDKRRRRRRAKKKLWANNDMNLILTSDEDFDFDISSAETVVTPRGSRSSGEGSGNNPQGIKQVPLDGEIKIGGKVLGRRKKKKVKRNMSDEIEPNEKVKPIVKKIQVKELKNVRFVEPNGKEIEPKGILKEPSMERKSRSSVVEEQREQISECINKDRWCESAFFLLCAVLLLLTACCLFASVSAMRDRAIYLKGYLAATTV